MKLAADMAAGENVPCTTEMLSGSSLAETLTVINNLIWFAWIATMMMTQRLC